MAIFLGFQDFLKSKINLNLRHFALCKEAVTTTSALFRCHINEVCVLYFVIECFAFLYSKVVRERFNYRKKVMAVKFSTSACKLKQKKREFYLRTYVIESFF